MASKTPGKRPSQRRADRDRRAPQGSTPVLDPVAPAVKPMARKIEKALRRAAGHPCYLCGGHASFVDIWWPSPEVQRQLLVALGRTRIFAYSLCQRCQADPDATTRIENLILAAVAETGERFGTN